MLCACLISMDIKNMPSATLYVVWCDRCGRAVNIHDERDHFHAEQCGGCRKYQRHDSDWGYCKHRESVYCGRLMFEHDGCSEWVEGEW